MQFQQKGCGGGESEKREKAKGERFINARDGYGPLGDCCNVSQ